jgi:hypothetical protein
LLQATFRPVEKWPGKQKPSWSGRARATFKATYADTLDLLEREINRLTGKSVVIQAYFERGRFATTAGRGRAPGRNSQE